MTRFGRGIAQARARAALLWLGVIVALVFAATALPVDVHGICPACGAWRVGSQVLHVPLFHRTTEGSRLASLAGAEHGHDFVSQFEVSRGWLTAEHGFGATEPWETLCVSRMEGLLESFGDDPELVALGRRFARTEPGERDERTRVLAEALALRAPGGR